MMGPMRETEPIRDGWRMGVRNKFGMMGQGRERVVLNKLQNVAKMAAIL